MSAIPTPLRVFYAIVAAFTFYVVFWGLFFPTGMGVALPGFAKNFDDALPFAVAVPPLHARFIGALYLSATVFNLCNLLAAKTWHQARLPTMMIFIWTGILLLVSLLQLAVFNWARPQVWIWFLVYLGFPAVAGLALWQYRDEPLPTTGAPIPPALRRYCQLQGVLVTLLGLALLLLPTLMIALWPWKISPFLSQLYSAPFLAYGLSSFVAARAHTWEEVRIFVYSVLVFPLAALVASLLHLALFNFAGPAAWVWFGSLIAVVIALSVLPSATVGAS
jgi:hypothetical protein